VDQKNLMDVCRTSVEAGTSSVDMLRAARFSVLSPSSSFLFPDDSLPGGYTGRSYGFPAFLHGSATPWLDALRQLIAEDIPVIVLQKWALNDTEGHWRVVVGYDVEGGKMVMLDPWDRDAAPRVLTVSTDHFISLWNKTDDAIADSTDAFIGMAIVPFHVQFLGLNTTETQGSIYSKNITFAAFYRCPEPFNCTTKALALERAQVRLDWAGISPCDSTGGCWIQASQNQQRQLSMDPVMPNEVIGEPQSWMLQCDQTRSGIACPHVFEQSWIRVSIYGLLTDHVPPVYCCGANIPYPPSHYMDAIGETLTLTLG
jgi:hypothetical protein